MTFQGFGGRFDLWKKYEICTLPGRQSTPSSPGRAEHPESWIADSVHAWWPPPSHLPSWHQNQHLCKSEAVSRRWEEAQKGAPKWVMIAPSSLSFEIRTIQAQTRFLMISSDASQTVALISKYMLNDHFDPSVALMWWYWYPSTIQSWQLCPYSFALLSYESKEYTIPYLKVVLNSWKNNLWCRDAQAQVLQTLTLSRLWLSKYF